MAGRADLGLVLWHVWDLVHQRQDLLQVVFVAGWLLTNLEPPSVAILLVGVAMVEVIPLESLPCPNIAALSAHFVAFPIE